MEGSIAERVSALLLLLFPLGTPTVTSVHAQGWEGLSKGPLEGCPQSRHCGRTSADIKPHDDLLSHRCYYLSPRFTDAEVKNCHLALSPQWAKTWSLSSGIGAHALCTTLSCNLNPNLGPKLLPLSYPPDSLHEAVTGTVEHLPPETLKPGHSLAQQEPAGQLDEACPALPVTKVLYSSLPRR